MERKAQAELGGITTGGSLMHSGAGLLEEPQVVEGLPTDRQPDFSGWATKANLKCSDGRTILKDAFAHQDMTQVPLVWQHAHDAPTNVLGHAILENRDEGVYCYGYFNDTDYGKHAKSMVEHGDINSLSIFANELKQQAKNVMHGIIREVSLVLARANPGALIDNLSFKHGDDLVTLDDEAVIYTGLEQDLKHADGGDEDGPTIQQVFDDMSDDQKQVVHFMVSEAVKLAKTDDPKSSVEHSALPAKPDPTNNKEEGIRMSRNVFEKNGGAPGSGTAEEHTLSHDAIKEIETEARRSGSLKAAFEGYALKHGIENIDVLFPDAKTIDSTPEFDKRRTEWVSSVLNGTRHVPFSRIKSMFADITHEEARAKGYIKGNFKKEEWISLAKRITTPTTIYKKQRLDRDDIIDITDIDVVVWLKGEMRLMLDEELARAILVGDGREADDEDKIRDPAGVNEGAGIRSIYRDHELYAARIRVASDLADANFGNKLSEAVLLQMSLYKGSGSPVFYTTQPVISRALLQRDGMGRRLWRTASDLATEMGVSSIVPVEVMEDDTYAGLVGIIVNLKDYAVGTDRGGDIAMFDDFDIDYNQYKYLIETRASGALTKIRSALVVELVADDAVLVVPEEPTFDGEDVLIPTNADVDYINADTSAPLADGSTQAVAAGATLRVRAVPAAGRYFANDQQDDWSFTNEA